MDDDAVGVGEHEAAAGVEGGGDFGGAEAVEAADAEGGEFSEGEGPGAGGVPVLVAADGADEAGAGGGELFAGPVGFGGGDLVWHACSLWVAERVVRLWSIRGGGGSSFPRAHSRRAASVACRGGWMQ
jgi:hypothetical protein